MGGGGEGKGEGGSPSLHDCYTTTYLLWEHTADPGKQRLSFFLTDSEKNLDNREKMTTLDDKLLGLKTQNYVSSSESEGEDDYDKSPGGEDRDENLGEVAAPPDFRLEVPKASIRLAEF